MSLFNNQRLTQETLHLDIEGIRRGYYSDKYFENISRMLQKLDDLAYVFPGGSPRLEDSISQGFAVGDAEVEMQIFTRRAPFALVGGVDCAIELLRHATGDFNSKNEFVSHASAIEIEAVQDGVRVDYGGDPLYVTPILKIRGPYRYFAQLETPILGYLTRISRIATNVYHVLVAARGKPVLFFPARFDLPAVQAVDGYAYYLAIDRYNHDYQQNVQPFISTDAQGAWFGGQGGGTVPHGVIATFLGNTPETMVQYARTQPPGVPRIALVDFENDCVGTSVAVAKAMFEHYRKCKLTNPDEAAKFRLDGVRLDTGGTMIDQSLEPMDDPSLNYGVNPRLVRAVRSALDNAWQTWDLENEWHSEAEAYCRNVKIVVTGGFNAEKIDLFEQTNVPADTYGVGSSLMLNSKETNTDFSADVVRIKISGQWYPIAKIGRQPRDNDQLESVVL